VKIYMQETAGEIIAAAIAAKQLLVQLDSGRSQFQLIVFEDTHGKDEQPVGLAELLKVVRFKAEGVSTDIELGYSAGYFEDSRKDRPHFVVTVTVHKTHDAAV